MSIRKMSNDEGFKKTNVVSNENDEVKNFDEMDTNNTGNVSSDKDAYKINNHKLNNIKGIDDTSKIDNTDKVTRSSSDEDLTSVNYDANKSIPKVKKDSLNNGSKNTKMQSLSQNTVDNVFAKSSLDDISVMPKGYFFTSNKKLFHKVGNSNIELGYAIRLVKRYRDMDSGKESYLGQYLEPYDNVTHTFYADATLFIPSGYHLLIEKGLPLTNANMPNIQEYFMSQKSLLPVHLKYKNIGWDTIDDQLVFKGKNIISRNNRIVGENTLSKYDLSSSGTYEEWMSMYNNYVKPNLSLQLGVIIGLASTIVPIIHKYVDSKLINIVLSLSGQSSSGKTTIAALAASVCGSTLGDPQTLMRNWDATDNAVTDVTGNNGCIIVLDELGTSRQKDLTRVIFSLAQGRDKQKKTPSSELMKTEGWSTVILSTGESKISEFAHGYEGLRVRLLEIDGLQFTPNSKVADKISNLTTKNYGTIQPIFVKWLLNQDSDFIDTIHNLYKAYYKTLIDQLPKTSLTDRINKILTTLVVTAKLANDCFKFDIDIDALVNLLLKYAFNDSTISIGDKAWDIAIQWLLQHQSKIKVNMGSNYVGSSIIGFGKNETNYYRIDVFSSVLIEFLHKQGFNDHRQVLKHWRKSGHLITSENDRMANRKQLDGERNKFYSLKIENNDMNNFLIFSNDVDENGVVKQIKEVAPGDIFNNSQQSNDNIQIKSNINQDSNKADNNFASTNQSTNHSDNDSNQYKTIGEQLANQPSNIAEDLKDF